MNILNRIQSYIRLQLANKRINGAIKQRQAHLSFGPSSINLMMTDACNSQCIMCGKDYKSCGSREYLSLEDMRIIYHHLQMKGVVDVIYGGGGEPFLNPDLADIAEYTRSQYPMIQHTVISNMIQWQEPQVEKLLASEVNFLVSINAASASTYEKVAGVNAYSQVVDHVGKLVELRQSLGGRSKISVSMILMRQNIEELGDFIDLAADLGVDEVKTLYVRIYPPEYRDKAMGAGPILPEDSLFYQQDLAEQLILAAEGKAKKRKMEFDHEPLFSCSRRIARNCCEPWKSLFINFNGDVYPCPASEILFKPKVDSGVYQSGNIIRQEIGEIWNNRFWQALRNTNLEGKTQKPVPECSCCGNAINWYGPADKASHILDWRQAQESDLSL